MKLLLFLLVLSILIILTAKKREPYTNLDDLKENINCYDYVTKELNWSLDHNLTLPQPMFMPGTPQYEQERNKQLQARKDVLESCDAVRSKVYSNINLKYPYAGACALTRNVSNIRNNSCRLSGNILTYDREDNYGKRKSQPNTVYTKTNTDNYVPSNGCFIYTNNKDEFFEKLDQLARMSIYDKELKENTDAQQNNKLKEQVSNLNDTLNLYGINPQTNYGRSLQFQCESRNTPANDNGGYSYNYLDRHNIACNQDEILNQVRLVHSGNRMYYNYKCCRPTTDDRNIYARHQVNRTTPSAAGDPYFQQAWNLSKHNVGCDQFLRSMRLGMQYPRNSYYDYNCSVMHKNRPQDRRNVSFHCFDKETGHVAKNTGTHNMQYLDINCGEETGINNIQMQDHGSTYNYKYKCCKPTINFTN